VRHAAITVLVNPASTPLSAFSYALKVKSTGVLVQAA